MDARSERASKLLQITRQCIAKNKDLYAKAEPVHELTGTTIYPHRMGGSFLAVNNPENNRHIEVDFTERKIYIGSKEVFHLAHQLVTQYKEVNEPFIIVKTYKE